MQPHSEKGCWHQSHTLMPKTDKKRSQHLQQNHSCQRLQKKKAFSWKDRWLDIWILVPRSQQSEVGGLHRMQLQTVCVTFNPNMNPVTVTQSCGRSRSSAGSPRSSDFLPGCPSLWSEQRQTCHSIFFYFLLYLLWPRNTVTYRSYCNPDHRWLNWGRQCCTMNSYLLVLRTGSGSSSSPLRSRSCRGSLCLRGEASPCKCQRCLHRRRCLRCECGRVWWKRCCCQGRMCCSRKCPSDQQCRL